MNEFLASLDWAAIISVIWTVVLLPIITTIGKKINDKFKMQKIEKYTNMLYEAAEIVVRDIQQSIVDNIKNTDEWTEEKIEEIRKLAINKAIASMSYEGYKILKEANSDLDSWIDSIIKAKLYDMKKYYFFLQRYSKN